MISPVAFVVLTTIASGADGPEPLDYVVTPPAGMRFVSPPANERAEDDGSRFGNCTRVIAQGGACLAGTVDGVGAEVHVVPAEAGGTDERCYHFGMLNGLHDAKPDGSLCVVDDLQCFPEDGIGCGRPFRGDRVWYRDFASRGVVVTVHLDDAPADAWQRALGTLKRAVTSLRLRDPRRLETPLVRVHLDNGFAWPPGSDGRRIASDRYELSWREAPPEARDDEWTAIVRSNAHTVSVTCRALLDASAPIDPIAKQRATCARLLDGVKAR